MDELERTSFEDHFFACADCFRTVQALEDARSVLAGHAFRQTTSGFLRGSGRGLPLQWMAAAAAVIVIVGLGVTVRRGLNPVAVPSRTEAVARSTRRRSTGRSVNVTGAGPGGISAGSEHGAGTRKSKPRSSRSSSSN